MNDPFDKTRIAQGLNNLISEIKSTQAEILHSLQQNDDLTTSHIETGYLEFYKQLEHKRPFRLNPFHCDLMLNGVMDILRRALAEREKFDALRSAWQERFHQLNELSQTAHTAKIEFESRSNLFGAEAAIGELSFRVSTEVAKQISEKIDSFLTQDQWSAQKAWNYTTAAGGTHSHGFLAQFPVQREQDTIKFSALEFAALSKNYPLNSSESYPATGNSTDKSDAKELMQELHEKVRIHEATTAKDVYARRVTDLLDNLELKLNAFKSKGAPHNYLEQLEPIRNRYVRDLLEAGERINCIAEGVRIIYGIDVTQPTIEDCTKSQVRLLDSYIAFTQNCIRLINNLSIMERRTTVSIYLAFSEFKELNNENDLRRATFKFRSPIMMASHIRIRNISAHLSRSTILGTISIGIKPPSTAVFKYGKFSVAQSTVQSTTGSIRICADDARPWLTTSSAEFLPSDFEHKQSQLGHLWLGRVFVRSGREPECQQNGELWNVSPLSAGDSSLWEVYATNSSRGEPIMDCEGGVELDLDIVFLEDLED
ncbi:hypothetical protein GJ700_27515 [Duganella sp. FT92W]|uniref:Uncharacterized protein n=1 Tax=Pseudoduganella rivuli TaxID=2666085 RepID=A0A7X2ISY9_9BURK|nr:hypothetical protein [Pseudoduganella rivuli]MRV75474.1 hypothetical protein [Pseudoduganella rivuli]